jgi:hypothetical protein
MSKLLKLLGKVATISLEWFLVFFICFAFLVRTSPVQTYLAQRATSYFSKELNTRVSIKRVSIVFFNRIVLDGVNIEDRKGEKIAYMKSLFVTLKGINQIKQEIRLRQLKIDQGVFHFNQNAKTGKFNYDFIIDYFTTNNSQKSTSYIVRVDQISLKDIDLKYDDYRYAKKMGIIDYEHIHLKKLYLFADNFSFNHGTIKAAIKHLSLHERCGFNIKRFAGYIKVSDQGIRVKELRTKTNRSEAYLPKFNMLYSKWDDFLFFDDKVHFDAIVENSSVNMKDIRFFASELEGMNQVCKLKAEVTAPLKQLTIDKLHLEFGENSILEGRLVLPDFRNLKQLNYNEYLSYAKITTKDIESFKFPVITGIKPIELNKYIEKFHFFECSNLQITGSNQNSNIYAKRIKTKIGSFRFNDGINIKYNRARDNYRFQSILAKQTFSVDSLDLGRMFDFKSIGNLTGKVNLTGLFDFKGDFVFEKIQGDITHVDLNKYEYKNIKLEEFSFKDEEIKSKFSSFDPNAQFDFDGLISLKNDYNYDFSTSVKNIDLFKTNWTSTSPLSFSGDFDMDVSGSNLNTLRGDVKAMDIVFNKNNKQLNVKQFVAELDRFKRKDELKVKSSIFDLNIDGDLDLKSIQNQVNNSLSAVFPTLLNKLKINRIDRNSNLDYSIRINDAKSFFDMFIPELKISKGTKLKGELSEDNLDFSLNATSFEFKGLEFKDLQVKSSLYGESLQSEVEATKFILSDTLRLSDFDFYIEGKDNLLNTHLQWSSGKEESVLSMNVSLASKTRMLLEILPSYFHLNKNRWDLYRSAEVIIDKNYLRFDNLELKHKDELIALDGVLSNNANEYANLVVSNFELENVSTVLGLPKKIKGKFNADIQLSNPFVKLEASGDALINDLVINKEKVGTIDLNGKWLPNNEAFQLKGNVIYRNNPSFNFSGFYFPFKEGNDTDFDLQFNGTDIQIANAFIDEELLNDIQGNLFGEMHLGGSLFNPELIGEIDLKAGRAKVEMLGVYFGFEGKLLSDRDGFYVNNMPITDQEGKAGSVVATIYHTKYKNWNYDINIDFLEDITSVPGMRIPLNRFLILNTNYKEGDVYYGKAYGRGTLNINGSESNVTINTDVETEEGTSVNFPMYGQSSVQEDKFISFTKKGEEIKVLEKHLDFTGVDFNLNLKINPSSKMRLIFDEKLGDEITAFGEGDINIKINQNDDILINGIYKIKNDANQKSTYNFVLGPIKQGFIIEDNGTISWNGNPYVAILDLTTYYNVNTSLNQILPVTSITSSSQSFQDIKCNLKLTESIEKPKLNFELELAKNATGVTDDARAALERINKTPEELNKQFVSLLLYKKFQPLLSSNNTVGSNAVADLVANQLNSLLSDLSKDYKFNVTYNTTNLNADPTQNTNNMNKLAMGVTKDFFDGKLLVNGTFGRTFNTSQSMLIGNVSVEYKLNEDGTIRVIAFNETNDFNVSAQLNSRTTQGGGINIQEEFASMNEFDLFQKMMNVFRTDNRKRIIKRRKKGRVPVVVPSTNLTPDNQQANYSK